MTGVLVETATEADWLAARRKGVTASEIGVLMGLSPYSSPYKLYHQKLGLLPPDDDSAAMERGRVLEPFIADKFASQHPQFAIMGSGRELYADPYWPAKLATPDRLLHGWVRADDVVRPREVPDAVLECKVDGGSDEWGEPGTDEIPVHYRCQVLWQCDVLGVQRWYVACLHVARWQVRVYSGEIDRQAETDLILLRREASLFLERMERGTPPDIDWRPATADALKQLHPGLEDRDVTIGRQLAISYRAACRRYWAAEERKQEMTNRLLDAIGSGRRAIEANTGQRVATRSVGTQKRVSATLVREQHPDVARACTVESPVIKLIPAETKKDAAQ